MQNLTYKILEKHLLKGKLEAGQPIEIKMDQTLTQDATGTMTYMQFEAMGVKKSKNRIICQLCGSQYITEWIYECR